jgi:hypothetical protein
MKKIFCASVMAAMFSLGIVSAMPPSHRDIPGPIPNPWDLRDIPGPIPNPWDVADIPGPIPNPWDVA